MHALNRTIGCFFGVFLLLSCGFISAQPCVDTATIVKRGKLIVGTYNDDPYFSYKNPQTGQLEGFDVDMAREIAKDILGDPNKIEFVNVGSEDRLPKLMEGNVDLIIAELSITQDRQKIVDFSEIYYVAGQSIIVTNQSPFNSIEELRDQKIGVLSGTTNELNVKQLLPNSKYVYFEHLSAGFQALNQGEIQALCIDDVMLIGLRKSHSFLKDYRFVGGEIALEGYGIAVKKGCGQLLDAVNKTLRKIKHDGTWQKIYDKNIGQVSKISAKPPV